jgi:hypothetical protein
MFSAGSSFRFYVLKSFFFSDEQNISMVYLPTFSLDKDLSLIDQISWDFP